MTVVEYNDIKLMKTRANKIKKGIENMKRKKLFSMVAALGLVATIGIGATLAYLSDKVDPIVNTFTVGDVDITLTEPDWDPEDAKDLTTGAEVSKNPIVTNTGANEAYILLSVNGMDKMAGKGFECVYDQANWQLVNADGTNRVVEDDPLTAIDESKQLVDGYYKYTQGALPVGEKTPALFTKVVFNGDEIVNGEYEVEAILKTDADGKVVDGSIDHYVINGLEGKTFATYDEARTYILENLRDKASDTFDLVLQASAVQTSSEYTFEEAEKWVPLAVNTIKAK